MAPENLLGNSITEKIDVYAFGLIFWEILTRANPFPDIKSFPQLKTHICEQNKRPQLKKIKHYGEELCKFLSSSPPLIAHLFSAPLSGKRTCFRGRVAVVDGRGSRPSRLFVLGLPGVVRFVSAIRAFLLLHLEFVFLGQD